MSVLDIITGPLICSLVGYGTNYIAVKMLFRPLKPVKVFGKTLPFTPGIIPKRKDRLGQAIGNAVGNNLFTSKDLEEKIMSEKSIATITEMIYNSLIGNEDDKNTIKKIIESIDGNDGTHAVDDIDNVNAKDSTDGIDNVDAIDSTDGIYNVDAIDSAEKINNLVISVQDIISDKIIEGASKIGIGKIIAKEGAKAVSDKVKGTFLAMMVNDELINSIAEPLGDQVEKYIVDNGKDMISPAIHCELMQIIDKPIDLILKDIAIEEIQIKNLVTKVVKSFMKDMLDEALKSVDINSIVSQKVIDMDVLELEELVMSVMKNELNAIVNLGALIGLIVGIVTIFI